MKASPGEASSRHNRLQRDYFERTIKRTMIPTGSPYVRRQVDEVLRLATIKPSERVIEIGCGMGRYTFVLAEMGIQVEGLDLSPVLLDRLLAYGESRFDIPLHCADIQSPPKNLETSFDIVLGFFVLHHLHSLDESFAAMAKLLKSGGSMLFLEPNPLNVLYYIQQLVTPGMMWRGDGGMVRMRPDPIFRAMSRAGLVRMRVSRFGFFPPFVANRRWAPQLERVLERVPVWQPFLPFQIFMAVRP